MNMQELMFSLQKILINLKDAWVIKILLSCTVTFFTSAQGRLLSVFIVLIIIDLFTRWLALSRQHLDDVNAEEKSILACLLNMRKARRAGYIKSSPMKHRFAGKFIWYALVSLLAAVLDIHMLALGEPQYFVKLLVAYMGVSEAISILENLQDAGMQEAGGLLDLIKKRRGGK